MYIYIYYIHLYTISELYRQDTKHIIIGIGTYMDFYRIIISSRRSGAKSRGARILSDHLLDEFPIKGKKKIHTHTHIYINKHNIFLESISTMRRRPSIKDPTSLFINIIIYNIIRALYTHTHTQSIKSAKSCVQVRFFISYSLRLAAMV